MTAGPSLDPAGEAAWLRFKQHLAWCDQFALVFLFSDQPAVIDLLRGRLAAIYRARITGLAIPLPNTPEELLTGLLPRLLDPPQYQQALNAPVWLDLTRPPPDLSSEQRAAWREAGLEFLARLNEQREPLRRTLSKPLILVLPLADKARIRALVPDLWAIRHFSLETGPWLVPAAPPAPAQLPTHPEPFPLSDTEHALVREWRRLRDKGGAGRGALLAGTRAYDALLRRGHLDEAKEATTWLVATARSRLTDTPEDPEALRDLSISLNNVGKIDQALGNRQAARDAFTEGLEIAQGLATALPEYEDYKNLPDWFERRLAELGELGTAREGNRG